MTISGSELPAEFLWSIRQAIHGVGLHYHKEKYYVGRPAEITGVIVDGGTLIVPNRQLKKLHATRQDLLAVNDKDLAQKLEDRLSGMLAQMSQIKSIQRQVDRE